MTISQAAAYAHLSYSALVRELRHLAGDKWLAFDGLEPLMERLANNRPKLHVALNNLELTITKDTRVAVVISPALVPSSFSTEILLCGLRFPD